MDKQCHPKALARTSRNPGCIKNAQPHWGLGLFRLEVTRDEMLRGKGLKRKGRYNVVHTTSNKVLGSTDDITLAMAYKVRGEARALYLEVEDNGP
jgi:hypothetical protein